MGGTGVVRGGVPAERSLDFILGADLSFVQEEEDSGVVYVDDGVEQDVLQILKHHGFNFVRLRLFNDPSSACRASVDGGQTCGYQFEFGERAEPYCDLVHTLEMAERVRAADLGFLLNLHFSDTWADPDDQNRPLAWQELSFEELVRAVRDFTADTLAAFYVAGTPPDLVQLGNEITAGILFPEGSSSAPGNWPRFAALLQAATEGAREVDPEIRIMFHLDKSDSFTTSDWWIENALARGLDFDVLGQSCYPEWQGPASGWKPTLEALAEKYPDLDFMIAEYLQEKRAANDIMFELPESRGLGTFIWEPTQWGETLFDRDGNRLVTNEWIGLYDQMAADYGIR
jgi:arabinogalactan endo-1,4-beta-galactosidase